MVTRRRLYHELLAEVLPKVERATIIDPGADGPLIRVVAASAVVADARSGSGALLQRERET